MRGTRPARIARSADAAAAVKPPAFGGLDRPRTEASAGRAYLVCRAGFRRPRHGARAGYRAFHSRVRSRPRDVSRVGLLGGGAVFARVEVVHGKRETRNLASGRVA